MAPSIFLTSGNIVVLAYKAGRPDIAKEGENAYKSSIWNMEPTVAGNYFEAFKAYYGNDFELRELLTKKVIPEAKAFLYYPHSAARRCGASVTDLF
ncbi:MAG: hypothetical protein IPP17_30375 [Bacteroidetes bacterium]|nr:hypothetical protein [Bacteroidota bacterium]